MRYALQLATVCVFVLFTQQAATAQMPVAPPPHSAAESLINGLTECDWHDWSVEWRINRTYKREPYMKVAEKGFDAIPALIEHMNDKRHTLTRSETVGDLATRLIAEYSVPDFGYWGFEGERTSRTEVLKWWKEAREVGEEQWLMNHVLPSRDKPFPFLAPDPCVNQVMLRALRVRYPNRLGEIYRKLLTKLPLLESCQIATEILDSKLSREKKIALFEEAAASSRFVHRYPALYALSEIDAPSFRKHLIKSLQWLPPDIEGDYYGSACEKRRIIDLIERADDRECWDALAAAAKRATVALRLELLDFDWPRDVRDSSNLRRERIRLLMQFLDDNAKRPYLAPEGKSYSGFTNEVTGGSEYISVRDFAAQQLAGLLGLKFKFDPFNGGLERFLLRGLVAQESKKEIARLKN